MTLSAVLPYLFASWMALEGGILDDQRLERVRPQLEASLAAAEDKHLPTALLVSKVREGLAKRVPPEAIAAAVEDLSRRLETAHAWLSGKEQPRPPVRLVKAVADAQLVGLEKPQLQALLATSAPEEARIQAIEVLTDLGLRGYVAAEALPLVGKLLVRDAGALAQLPATLEVVRRDFALTTTEATQAVDQGMAREGSLVAAAARARNEAARADRGKGKGESDRDDEGRGRGVQANPGRGMGKDMGKGSGKGR